MGCGLKTVERSVMEHHMVAVSNIHSNIYFSDFNLFLVSRVLARVVVIFTVLNLLTFYCFYPLASYLGIVTSSEVNSERNYYYLFDETTVFFFKPMNSSVQIFQTLRRTVLHQ